jgi:hypothetical protein
MNVINMPARHWRGSRRAERMSEILLEYINHRKADIKREQQRIHIFPPNRREIIRRQLRGRVLELDHLRIEIEQGRLEI